MTNYTLAGVSLRDYGIVEGCASGSNIAITGIYDLSARTGKCYYVWGDSDGVEPYFDADDIVLGSRKITLCGTLWGKTIVDAKSKIKALSDKLYSQEVTVLKCDYGTYNLHFEGASVSEWHSGKGTIVMNFNEIAPEFKGGILPVVSADDGVDGYSWSSLGLRGVEVKGLYDIQGKNEIKTSDIKFGGMKHSEITLTANISAQGYNDFYKKIKALYLLFTKPNERVIKYNGLTINAFVVDGFSVTNVWDLWVKMIGEITIKMIVL